MNIGSHGTCWCLQQTGPHRCHRSWTLERTKTGVSWETLQRIEQVACSSGTASGSCSALRFPLRAVPWGRESPWCAGANKTSSLHWGTCKIPGPRNRGSTMMKLGWTKPQKVGLENDEPHQLRAIPGGWGSWATLPQTYWSCAIAPAIGLGIKHKTTSQIQIFDSRNSIKPDPCSCPSLEEAAGARAAPLSRTPVRKTLLNASEWVWVKQNENGMDV